MKQYLGVCLNPYSELNRPEFREFTHRDLQAHLLGFYDEQKASVLLNKLLACEFGPVSFEDPDDPTSKPRARAFTLTAIQNLIEASRICNMPTDALEAGEVRLKIALKRFEAGHYVLGDFPQRREIDLDLTAFETPEVLKAFEQMLLWKKTGQRGAGDPEKLRKGTKAILTLQQLCALTQRPLPPMRSSGQISP
jgi:hypothetical protein